MATLIADLIVHDEFKDYVNEATINGNAMIQSGAMIADSDLNGNKGYTLPMPFFQEPTTDEEVLTDATTATVDKITAAEQVAVMLHRVKAFEVKDMAKIVSGSDPMGAIAQYMASYYAGQDSKILLNTFDGLFDATGALAGTHVNDVSVAIGTAIIISPSNVIETQALIGESMLDLSLLIVHPVVFGQMRIQGLVTYETGGAGTAFENMQIPYYGNARVQVDSRVGVDTTTPSYFKYDCYLLAQGAIATSSDQMMNAEMDRNILTKSSVISTDRHLATHVLGTAWAGANINGGASNAELATVGSWSKVWNNNNIKVAKLVVNG